MRAFGGGSKGFAKGCLGKLEGKQDLGKPTTLCTVTGNLAALEANIDAFAIGAARDIKNAP
jgi:hypothetical protein